MNTDQKTARAVGALFIITMILGMIDAYTVAPILHASLADYYLNESQFYIGAFSILLLPIWLIAKGFNTSAVNHYYFKIWINKLYNKQISKTAWGLFAVFHHLASCRKVADRSKPKQIIYLP